MPTTDTRIADAKNLRELLFALQQVDSERDAKAAETGNYVAESYDAANLPTFGGETPSNTHGIWSWDENHILVCVNGWEIISRHDQS